MAAALLLMQQQLAQEGQRIPGGDGEGEGESQHGTEQDLVRAMMGLRHRRPSEADSERLRADAEAKAIEEGVGVVEEEEEEAEDEEVEQEEMRKQGEREEVHRMMERSKRIAQHIRVLLHARNCRGGTQCLSPACEKARILLGHIASCPAVLEGGGPCPVEGCISARRLMEHVRQCSMERRMQQQQLLQQQQGSSFVTGPRYCLICSLVWRKPGQNRGRLPPKAQPQLSPQDQQRERLRRQQMAYFQHQQEQRRYAAMTLDRVPFRSRKPSFSNDYRMSAAAARSGGDVLRAQSASPTSGLRGEKRRSYSLGGGGSSSSSGSLSSVEYCSRATTMGERSGPPRHGMRGMRGHSNSCDSRRLREEALLPTSSDEESDKRSDHELSLKRDTPDAHDEDARAELEGEVVEEEHTPTRQISTSNDGLAVPRSMTTGGGRGRGNTLGVEGATALAYANRVQQQGITPPDADSPRKRSRTCTV